LIEAPRDPAAIDLRIMCDCQSGGIAHYSRHRDRADFDNLPRAFNLPMMLTSGHADQHFPPYLVYSAATGYLDWRWSDVMDTLDIAAYGECVIRFCALVLKGDHRLLVLLPPDNAAADKYYTPAFPTRTFGRDRAIALNPLWKAAAALHHLHRPVVHHPGRRHDRRRSLLASLLPGHGRVDGRLVRKTRRPAPGYRRSGESSPVRSGRSGLTDD
jgi:hypothetical protein